jgi:hypothetical protein
VATVETASFVGTRVPGRGGSYAPRPSLSAGDNSLAVDLFRRPVDLRPLRNRSDGDQSRQLLLNQSNAGTRLVETSAQKMGSADVWNNKTQSQIVPR